MLNPKPEASVSLTNDGIPLASPAPPGSLSNQINAATKKLHTELNRLITTRLALALPPCSPDPSVYTHGIAAFAQIYLAFEDAWQEIIYSSLKHKSDEPEQKQARTGNKSHDRDIKQYLCTLIPPGLWRTQRLEQDLSYLRATFPVSKDDKTTGTQAQSFSTHIYEAVQQKPHVLLAYAWVMYMATFSGGRWIRAQLSSTSPGFWTHETSSKTSSSEPKSTPATTAANTTTATPPPGVSFLSFDGPSDGEDIKTEFKSRLATADDLLTPAEKDDILSEAKEIFTRCIALVQELDTILDTPARLARLKSQLHSGQVQMQGQGQGRGEDALDKLIAQSKVGVYDRVKENREAMPYAYPTKDVHPLAALVCIVLGVAVWYFLNSRGFLPSTSSGFVSSSSSQAAAA